MPLRFVKSQKGGNLLCLEGYLYSVKSRNKNSITWRYIDYVSRRCKVTVKTDSETYQGKVVSAIPEHEHKTDAARVKAKVCRERMKSRAQKSDRPPKAVVSQSLTNLSLEVSARLPKPNSLVRTVQRSRKKCNPVFQDPKSRGELSLPLNYTITNNKEPFLLYDSGGDHERFLLFTTAKNLEYLAGCDQWLADGTFKTAPSLFKQLYSIHGLKNNKTLPSVYILAPSKRKRIYKRFLNVVKDLRPDLKPAHVMVDFEESFINAMNECFPDTAVSGCFFHFCQSNWRQIQSTGLQKIYNSNSNFALNMRLFLALAFVPQDNVVEAYNAIMATDFVNKNEDKISDFLKYFEYTWVGNLTRTGRSRRTALFKINLWNCHDAVRDGRMRSNNSVEGWHHSFNSKIRINHASVGIFINALKEEQNLTQICMNQIGTGLNIATSTRKAYANVNERIKNVVDTYDKNCIMEYLKNIAAILSL